MTERDLLEADITVWLDSLEPAERQAEGYKLVGFLASRLAYVTNRPETAALFAALAQELNNGRGLH